MYDPSFVTYTVSLHFSTEITESIASTVEAIAEMTGNRFTIENKIPPHYPSHAPDSKSDCKSPGNRRENQTAIGRGGSGDFDVSVRETKMCKRTVIFDKINNTYSVVESL